MGAGGDGRECVLLGLHSLHHMEQLSHETGAAAYIKDWRLISGSANVTGCYLSAPVLAE